MRYGTMQDADSANFDGGSLTVALLNGASPTESLGIRNQGTNPFQIGVSGSDITYGGTVIGSFTGGGAGSSLLTVTLNANATPLAVRVLAQNITYQNTAPPAGTTDRYVGFRVSDGDGGVSAAVNVEIQIQPSLTPAVLVVDDIESSVTLTESQAQAGGFVLDSAVQVVYNGANSCARHRRVCVRTMHPTKRTAMLSRRPACVRHRPATRVNRRSIHPPLPRAMRPF